MKRRFASVVVMLFVLFAFSSTVNAIPTGPAVGGPATDASQTSPTATGQIDNVRSQMNAAIARVQQIVNQPVRQFRLGPNMSFNTFNEGWFHEGATKPDFNTVDIRPAQVGSYDKYQYVTSPLNPGIYFHGPDLAFNPHTKMFITDRTTPKKKLTDAEMVEINGLYRIIGQCETELNRLTYPAPTPVPQPAETSQPMSAEDVHYVKPTGRPGINNMAGKLILAGIALIAGWLVFRRIWA